MTREWVVASEDGGHRLDLVLAKQLGRSRAQAKALIEDGFVRVDGRRAAKGQLIAAGARVALRESPGPGTASAGDEQAVSDAPAATVASDGATATRDRDAHALVVLWEDDALAFVAKPAGMPSVPLRDGERGTLATLFAARYPESVGVGDDAKEAGLAHRLDTQTSGIVVGARTREAWLALRAAFSTVGEIDKRYLALCTGPLEANGKIELNLEQAGNHVRPSLSEGREARTHFEVLRRRAPYSYVELVLRTGVMHQARAHLAAIGAPLVGDALYGGQLLEGLERHFLHASRLTLRHPHTQAKITVAAPLPPDLEAALARVFGDGNVGDGVGVTG